MTDSPRPVGKPPGKTHDRFVGFKMPRRLYDAVCTLAEADGIAPGTWIRRCVDRAVRRRELP